MREGESLDERLRKELLRSELKERNNGKKIIRCKYRPKYPDSAEREYVRLINAYMTIEKEVLMKYIQRLSKYSMMVHSYILIPRKITRRNAGQLGFQLWIIQ